MISWVFKCWVLLFFSLTLTTRVAADATLPNTYFGGMSFFETVSFFKDHQSGFYFPPAVNASDVDVFFHFKPAIFGYSQSYLMALFPDGDRQYGVGYYETSVDDIPVVGRNDTNRPVISGFTSHSLAQYVAFYSMTETDYLTWAIQLNGYLQRLDAAYGSAWSASFGADYQLYPWLHFGVWMEHLFSSGFVWDSLEEPELVERDVIFFWRFFMKDFDLELSHNFQYLRSRLDWKLSEAVSLLTYCLVDRSAGEDFWIRQYGVGMGMYFSGFGIQYVYQWDHLSDMVLSQNSVSVKLGI